MKIKVAAICPTTEKQWVQGELMHQYPYPGASLDEAVAGANAMVDRAVLMLEEAAAQGAKMACLPEGLTNLGRWRREVGDKRTLREAWSRTWDHFCTRMGDAAQRTGLVVVAGSVEVEGRDGYNTAALFDDRGNLIGRYRKVQLARGENKRLKPGQELPVFKTRYGNVGMFICWDIIYPEVTQGLMLNGADILFQPTYGHAGNQADFTAQTRAHDAVCPLVISMWCGNGRIIDRDGTILARGHMTRDWRGTIPDQILYAEVDPKAPRQWLGYKDFRKGLLAERQWAVYQQTAERLISTVNGNGRGRRRNKLAQVAR